jgi:hypothetical protein
MSANGVGDRGRHHAIMVVMSDNDDDQVWYANFDAIPDVRDMWLDNANNVVLLGMMLTVISISSIVSTYGHINWLPFLVLGCPALFVFATSVVAWVNALIRKTGIRRALKKRGLTPGAVARPLISAYITDDTRLNTPGRFLPRALRTKRRPMFAAYTGGDEVPTWADRAWFRSRFGSDIDGTDTDNVIAYNGFSVMIDSDKLPEKACEILDTARTKFKHGEWLYECIETPRWQELGRELAMTEPVTQPATFAEPAGAGSAKSADENATAADARRRLRSLMDEVTVLADRLRMVLPDQSADRQLIADNLSGLRRRMAAEIGLLGTAGGPGATTMERTIKGYESLIREMSASLDVLGDDSNMETLRRDIDDMNAVAALKTGERRSSVKSR